MTFIIGDIHGCAFTLEKLLSQIYSLDSKAKLVFVGDYVDRGTNSREVIDILLGLERSTFLCGNHDDVINWILNRRSFSEVDVDPNSSATLSFSSVCSWWSMNGLLQTMQSYLKRKPGWNMEDYEEFVEKVPDSHKQFFDSLRLFWSNETHFACHAYMDPDAVDVSEDTVSLCAYSVLWNRFRERFDTNTWKAEGISDNIVPKWNKIGVFGHTPVNRYGPNEPLKHHNIRLIDMGAFTGNKLAAYICETDDFILQDTDSRDYNW